MKQAMTTHIEQNRIEMFESSVNSVREQLVAMLRSQEKALGEAVDHIFTNINRDYRSVLGGGVHGEILPKAQRILRGEVFEIINSVERIFQGVVGFKMDEDSDELAKGKEHEERSQKASASRKYKSEDIPADNHNGSEISQRAAIKKEDDEILTAESSKHQALSTAEDSDSHMMADPSSPSTDEAGRMSSENAEDPSTAGDTEEEIPVSDTTSDDSE